MRLCRTEQQQETNTIDHPVAAIQIQAPREIVKSLFQEKRERSRSKNQDLDLSLENPFADLSFDTKNSFDDTDDKEIQETEDATTILLDTSNEIDVVCNSFFDTEDEEALPVLMQEVTELNIALHEEPIIIAFSPSQLKRHENETPLKFEDLERKHPNLSGEIPFPVIEKERDLGNESEESTFVSLGEESFPIPQIAKATNTPPLVHKTESTRTIKLNTPPQTKAPEIKRDPWSLPLEEESFPKPPASKANIIPPRVVKVESINIVPEWAKKSLRIMTTATTKTVMETSANVPEWATNQLKKSAVSVTGSAKKGTSLMTNELKSWLQIRRQASENES
jgi:hypothetical protein